MRAFTAWTALLLALWPATEAHAQARGRPILLDVPYATTPPEVVAAMLRFAGVGKGDVVYDLGSGDGRIVIAAVRDFGARRGVGVDLDPRRVRDGRANADRAGVADRVRFVRGDVFKIDFSPATVITLYMSERINRELLPRLLRLRPGTRIVSYRWHVGDWPPDRMTTLGGRDIRFWIVPADVAGRWVWEAAGRRYHLALSQTFQHVAGTLRSNGEAVPIENVQLSGDQFSFAARLPSGLLRFDGQVAGNALNGVAGNAGVSIRHEP